MLIRLLHTAFDPFLVFPWGFLCFLSFGTPLVLLRESVGEAVEVTLNRRSLTVNNLLCNQRYF